MKRIIPIIFALLITLFTTPKRGADWPRITAECTNEGDQSLTEYKPQIGGQSNLFENIMPIEIHDRPGEDMPF